MFEIVVCQPVASGSPQCKHVLELACPRLLEVMHKVQGNTASYQAYRVKMLLETGSSKGRNMRISSTLSEPVTQSWLAVTEHRKNRGHRKGNNIQSSIETRKSKTCERPFQFLALGKLSCFKPPERSQGQRRGDTQILMVLGHMLPPSENCDLNACACGSSDLHSQQLPTQTTASSCGPWGFESLWHISCARQRFGSFTETKHNPHAAVNAVPLN